MIVVKISLHQLPERDSDPENERQILIPVKHLNKNAFKKQETYDTEDI